MPQRLYLSGVILIFFIGIALVTFSLDLTPSIVRQQPDGIQAFVETVNQVKHLLKDPKHCRMLLAGVELADNEEVTLSLPGQGPAGKALILKSGSSLAPTWILAKVRLTNVTLHGKHTSGSGELEFKALAGHRSDPTARVQKILPLRFLHEGNRITACRLQATVQGPIRPKANL